MVLPIRGLKEHPAWVCSHSPGEWNGGDDGPVTTACLLWGKQRPAKVERKKGGEKEKKRNPSIFQLTKISWEMQRNPFLLTLASRSEPGPQDSKSRNPSQPRGLYLLLQKKPGWTNSSRNCWSLQAPRTRKETLKWKSHRREAFVFKTRSQAETLNSRVRLMYTEVFTSLPNENFINGRAEL